MVDWYLDKIFVIVWLGCYADGERSWKYFQPSELSFASSEIRIPPPFSPHLSPSLPWSRNSAKWTGTPFFPCFQPLNLKLCIHIGLDKDGPESSSYRLRKWSRRKITHLPSPTSATRNFTNLFCTKWGFCKLNFCILQTIGSIVIITEWLQAFGRKKIRFSKGDQRGGEWSINFSS